LSGEAVYCGSGVSLGQQKGIAMRIAVTGATGFLGRYIVRQLAGEGHSLRCWKRPTTDTSGFEDVNVDWVVGGLGDDSAAELIRDCHAVVHAALDRPGASFRGGEGDVVSFVQKNLIGTLQLIEAARSADVCRFVFVSTCAVYEKILSDRPLDEAHPLWPASHYGAHKAAIEKFVHSYGQGHGFPICAIRPTGIYGLDHPPQSSKWFDLVRAVVRGDPVNCRLGGKEIHAADVARAISILLAAHAKAITARRSTATTCMFRSGTWRRSPRAFPTVLASSAAGRPLRRTRSPQRNSAP